MAQAPKPPDFYTKTGLHVEPIASNEQLWATGLVVSLWTLVEHLISVYADALCVYDREAAKLFHSEVPLKTRIRKFRELVNQNVLPEFQPKLIDFVDRIGSMQQSRDRIVHGMWSYNLDHPKEEPPNFLINVARSENRFSGRFPMMGFSTWRGRSTCDCRYVRLSMVAVST